MTGRPKQEKRLGARIDVLLSAMRHAVGTLKQRRGALITAAGEVDVRTTAVETREEAQA